MKCTCAHMNRAYMNFYMQYKLLNFLFTKLFFDNSHIRNNFNNEIHRVV